MKQNKNSTKSAQGTSKKANLMSMKMEEDRPIRIQKIKNGYLLCKEGRASNKWKEEIIYSKINPITKK